MKLAFEKHLEQWVATKNRALGRGYEMGERGLCLRHSGQLLGTYGKTRSKVETGWTDE